MHLERCSVWFLASAFLFPLNLWASDIVGGQAPVLSANQIDEASQAALAKRCEEAHLMSIPNRGQCDEIVRNAKLTQRVFDYCQDRFKNDRLAPFIDCIQRGSGRDYPPDYIAACKGVSVQGNHSLQVCPEYLANTQSSFNEEAFHLCLEHHQRKLDSAKPCLNAIRDRQIDVQRLKKACVQERGFEKFDDCVARITDSSPALNGCGRRALSRPSENTQVGTK